MPQYMGALAPERCDRFADGEVRPRGMTVHIASISDFGKSGGGDEMDLGMRQRFQSLVSARSIRRLFS